MRRVLSFGDIVAVPHIVNGDGVTFTFRPWHLCHIRLPMPVIGRPEEKPAAHDEECTADPDGEWTRQLFPEPPDGQQSHNIGDCGRQSQADKREIKIKGRCCPCGEQKCEYDEQQKENFISQ